MSLRLLALLPWLALAGATSMVVVDDPGVETTDVNGTQPPAREYCREYPGEFVQGGGYLGLLMKESLEECKATCDQLAPQCQAITYWSITKDCWLSSSVGKLTKNPMAFSAVVGGCEGARTGTESDFTPLLEVCVSRYSGFASPGMELVAIEGVADEEACVKRCNNYFGCTSYSYFFDRPDKVCQLKSGLRNELLPEQTAVSGILKPCDKQFTAEYHYRSDVRYDFPFHSIAHDVQRSQDCRKMCGFVAECQEAVHFPSTQTCVLMKSRPSGPMALDPSANSFVRLSGRFQFYPQKTLKADVVGVELLSTDPAFSFPGCEDICYEKKECTAFKFDVAAGNCSCYKGVFSDDMFEDIQDAAAFGLRAASRFCWKRFPKFVGPVTSYGHLMRIVNRVPTEQRCQEICRRIPGERCQAYTYYPNTTLACWIKRKMEETTLVSKADAVSAVRSTCAPQLDVAFHSLPGLKSQPAILSVRKSDSGATCWAACRSSQACVGYAFFPDWSACVLLAALDRPISPAPGVQIGFRLTGKFTAYKWRRFEGVDGKQLATLDGLPHARACEESCLSKTKEGCVGYTYNFFSYACTLYKDVQEWDLWDFGGTMGGILRKGGVASDYGPGPVIPAN